MKSNNVFETNWWLLNKKNSIPSCVRSKNNDVCEEKGPDRSPGSISFFPEKSTSKQPLPAFLTHFDILQSLEVEIKLPSEYRMQ